MANDPGYVRLANRLTQGMVADVGGSGWSISGFDVLPFPKDSDAAARFVRHELRDGKLEPAGKAEYEEVQDSHKAVSSLSHQEAQVQDAARRENAKLVDAREADAQAGDDYEDPHDAKTREYEERLDGQSDDETDDPEEQAARNKQRPAEKKKSGKSKSKKSKESV